MTCLTGMDHYTPAGVVGWKPGQCELYNHNSRNVSLALYVYAALSCLSVACYVINVSLFYIK